MNEPFLRWLHELDGPAELGQLRIVREGAGWLVRHQDDGEGVVPEADWRAAREWVKAAADGSYRPLKGEGNLAPGRALGPLGDAELIEALKAIYPTAVANGVLFREGRLRVTEFAETAGRQTGMYRIVGTLTGEQLEEVVAGVCERRCLKVRLWAPRRGEPKFVGAAWPLLCPEACNLLVAACRAKIKGQPLDAAVD
ncbi:MAG: DR2241 family protein [Verrucomicrobiia bacterium]